MKKPLALFSLGFRPFFFMASVFAALAMLIWFSVYLFSLKLLAFEYYPSTVWHAHEMVFGYSMAVIAGFLLTAIKNWTGIQTANSWHLFLLICVWIVGRVIPFVVDSGCLIALLDSLFLPLLAVYIAIPLVKVGNKRNYFMIALVLVLSSLNILLHLELLGLINNIIDTALKSAFYLIIALIIVMAGRVFPMFSQNGVPNRYQVTKYVWVERLALPSYFAFAIALIFVQIPIVVLITGLFAAAVHLMRLKGWYNPQIWQVPLVWVLHIGYLFLIVGLLMSILGAYKPEYIFLALHAFSIGVLGIVTIGMMARVSIGHTGRDLRNPPKFIKVIFVAMVLAVIIRVFASIWFVEFYRWTIVVSAGLWFVAFALFVWVYAKIWIKPRVDEN